MILIVKTIFTNLFNFTFFFFLFTVKVQFCRILLFHEFHYIFLNISGMIKQIINNYFAYLYRVIFKIFITFLIDRIDGTTLIVLWATGRLNLISPSDLS